MANPLTDWILVVLCLASVSCSSGLQRPRRIESPLYWGQWSEWSPCSSTCGQGVTSQTRHCLTWSADRAVRVTDAWRCTGRSERKKICRRQACARHTAAAEDGPGERSTSDCGKLGDSGRSHSTRRAWRKVNYSGKPCKIICRREYPLTSVTIGNEPDGTACEIARAVDGVCKHGDCKARRKPTSCEGEEGTQLQFDMCLRCGGDNSTCYLVRGMREPALSARLDTQGDEFVVLIPQGATSIIISKTGLGRHNLALVNSRNTYLLSPSQTRLPGHSVFMGGGTEWTHNKSPGEETLATSGPVEEDILVLVVGESRNHKTSYSFWAPRLDSDSKRRISNAVDDPSQAVNFPNLLPQRPATTSGNDSEVWDGAKARTDVSGYPHLNTRMYTAGRGSDHRVERISEHGLTKNTGLISGDTSSGTVPKDYLINNSGRYNSNNNNNNNNNSSHADKINHNRNTLDNEVIISHSGSNRIPDDVGRTKHAPSHGQLFSPGEKEFSPLGKASVSGGDGSPANGFSKFEPGTNWIGEARAEHDNKGRGVPGNGPNVVIARSQAGGRDGEQQPGGRYSGSLIVNTLPSSGQTYRGSVNTNEVDPPRQTPALKSEKVTHQLESKRKGRDKQRKKRRKKKKKKKKKRKSATANEEFLTVSLGEPYDCYPCPRANNRKKQFCESDFVSKIYVNRRKVLRRETRYDVTILSSYRNRVELMSREFLWVASRCRCPHLRAKRTYILMGRMEQHKGRQARLVIAPGAFVRGFSLGQDHRLRLLARKLTCPE